MHLSSQLSLHAAEKKRHTFMGQYQGSQGHEVTL